MSERCVNPKCRRRLRLRAGEDLTERAGLCARCFARVSLAERQAALGGQRIVEPSTVGRRSVVIARQPLEREVDGVLYEVVYDGTRPEVVLQ